MYESCILKTRSTDPSTPIKVTVVSCVSMKRSSGQSFVMLDFNGHFDLKLIIHTIQVCYTYIYIIS